MAGLVLAESVQTAFVSPHRKKKWWQRRIMAQCAPLGNAFFSPRGCRIDRRRDAGFFRDAGLSSGRDWSLMMRGRVVIDVASSVGCYKSRLVMSALPVIDFAALSDVSRMQSSNLELAPVEVESVSGAAPSLGEYLLTLSHFLVNTLLDPYVQVAAFILVVLALAKFAEGGESRARVVDGGKGKSLEVVSYPSPFNLFVTKRCPSISSPSTSLTFGRKEPIGGEENRPVYQRKCVFAGDGGVVAIDWPAQLELTGEDGFDNVLLLVPGTTEGSRDDGVEKFVMDAMRLGYFPVVLNPRGCAGSPLITPSKNLTGEALLLVAGARVFTAADSDDVRLVIQHIMSAQPGATVMGVGWGFGANMLAKYLGEEGSSASLLAAVCISNPFDLQETSRHLSGTNGGQFDRAMSDGLVRILEANKMLFVGEKKGYDLNKALAATSVCEFEAAISRAAHGSETLDDFYATGSSINNVSSVQTPVLFIQGEDDAFPAIIPRQTIEANPFTTAILAQFPTNTSFSKAKNVKEPGSASRHYWSHTIALEWLAAVELALLKGRHPCLDITSVRNEVEENVSVSSRLPGDGLTEDKERASNSHKVYPLKEMIEQTADEGGQENNVEVASGSKMDSDVMEQEKDGVMVDGSENGSVPRLENHDPVGQESSEQVVDGAQNGIVSKAGGIEAKKAGELDASANSEGQNGVPEEEAAPPEGEPEGEPEEGSEAFQMRMAAESIMNVLDITMPGTLTDEKKTQVLTAVGKGETILTALQEAVPEDVRGTMATAVSGAVQARGLSFNVVGFGKNMPPPSLPAGLISSIKGKLEAVSGGKNETAAVPSPSPVSESSSPGTSEPEKQNREVHETGNSKDAGSSEKSKTQDPKEEHGPLDPQNSKATPGGEASDQGHADPETSDSKKKTNDSGSKAKASDGVEEEKFNKEKASSERATNDPSSPKDDMAKDPKGEVSDLKGNSEGKPVGGKNEESNERQEKADNKEAEKKDGGREAPVDQVEQKDDRQPGSSKGSDEQGVKEENKPEGVKEESKPEGVKEENKPEGVKEEKKPEAVEENKPEGVKEEKKPEGVKEEKKPEGVEENKPEVVKGENKPEGAKEEIKAEGDNVPSPGAPDPVTAAPTPSPAPPVPAPASNPIPEKGGIAPPIDMGLALEALTGFDDSTQMAVTNVFGVVESMLEQMEKDQKASGLDSSNDLKGAAIDHEMENDKVKNDGEKEEQDKGEKGEQDKGEKGEQDKGEREKQDKRQKPTEPVSPDGVRSATADHENEHGKAESDEEEELRKEEQKASEPSSPASELTGDYENGNGGESVGQNAYQIKNESAHATPNEEDRDATAARSFARNLEKVDNGGSNQKITKNDKSARGVAVKATGIEQGRFDNTSNNQNLHDPHDGDSVQKPFSEVLTTRRVGNSIFVASAFNFGASKVPNNLHAEQNGAASGFVAASKDLEDVSPKEGTTNGAGPQVHQLRRSNSLSRDVKVTKVVPIKMTMEQLLVEVDRESQQEPDKEETQGSKTIEVEADGIKEAESSTMVEKMVTDALKLEVLRRLGVAGMESLGLDLEKEVAKVADAVAAAVQKWKQKPSSDGSGSGSGSGKLGILESDTIVNTLGSVVSGTTILGGLVPIGVLAGVVLASLGAVYLIVTDQQESKKGDEGGEGGEEDDGGDESKNEEENCREGSSWHKAKESALDVPVLSVDRHGQVDTDEPVEGTFDFWEDGRQGSEVTDDTADDGINRSEEPTDASHEGQTEGGNNNKFMGMMAAAVSGGAALAGMGTSNNGSATNEQDNQNTANDENAGTNPKNPSIVSSFHPLAEKALSVAAPVVPTNEDGEIDHERLVAMLADLGQRGGFFRLIGKVALLWGGLRGAMSLTDRLLVFLRVNERPLHLRLVGFAAMTVLLWSPVLVPVLPSLLQKWATKSPNGVADAASVVGLYGAIFILITIWGKRVRGHSKPLLHYGLRLYSRRKLRDVISGLALGCVSVTALYTTNAFLGFLKCDWRALLATNTKFLPRLLPGAVGVTIFTTMKIFRLLGQALGIGLAVALVEEVLFRSWLQEEIAVDLGFHRAVFLSALAFSLIHWSPQAMPGLWFLAVALAGARAKTGRNLAVPIGLHAGLVAANYVLTVGGVVQFLPHAPTWVTGAHVGNPLAGALGTAMAAVLAVTLYPRKAINPPVVTVPMDSAKEVAT